MPTATLDDTGIKLWAPEGADVLLTGEQLCTWWQISRESLRQRHLTGDAPKRVRVGTRSYRYRLSDVLAYMREVDHAGQPRP